MTTEANDTLSQVDFSDGHPIGVAWNGWTLLLDYKLAREDYPIHIQKRRLCLRVWGWGVLM